METGPKIVEKQKEYCAYIVEIAKKKSFPKKMENLNSLLILYYQFCERYQLEPFNIEVKNALKDLYILESEPLLFEIDQNKLQEALVHLETVKNQNKDQLQEGIRLEEAKVILDYVLQKVRKILKECCLVDVVHNSLNEYSKMGQEITMNMFLDMGLEVTINNDTIFTNLEKPMHYFGTVAIPIKENDGVILNHYLIDSTYRRFFTFFQNHQGLLNKISLMSPQVGYYACQSKEGRIFSNELLKNGYVLLTSENAKIYGSSFAFHVFFNTEEALKQCLTMDKEIYLKEILTQQEKLQLDKEQLIRLGYPLDSTEVAKNL